MATAPTQSVDSIATQFLPASLTEWSRTHPGAADLTHWAAAEVDLDGSGTKDYVVIAYSDNESGRVRVIKRTSDGPVLVSDPAFAFHERSPEIKLRDLDADGRQDVIVTYVAGNRAIRHSWVLFWKDSSLRCAVQTAVGCPDFIDPVFADLDGDERLEIVEPDDSYGVRTEFESPEDAEANGPVVSDRRSRVYTWANGVYTESSAPVEYFNVFTRRVGSPVRSAETFRATPGNFVLRVVNGDSGTGKVVDSGQIKLNGRIVVNPSSFAQKRRSFEVTVQLKDSNTIEVELFSAPGSSIRVLLRPN